MRWCAHRRMAGGWSSTATPAVCVPSRQPHPDPRLPLRQGGEYLLIERVYPASSMRQCRSEARRVVTTHRNTMTGRRGVAPQQGPQPGFSRVDERPARLNSMLGLADRRVPAGRRIAMIVILRRRSGRRGQRWTEVYVASAGGSYLKAPSLVKGNAFTVRSSRRSEAILMYDCVIVGAGSAGAFWPTGLARIPTGTSC